MMKSKGYACRTTAYGEEAVVLATENHFDLILLDIMLPDIDGYEVLRRLQAANVGTPVLIQSGIIGRDEMEKGVGFGVDDYLGKPFSRNELDQGIDAGIAPFAPRPHCPSVTPSHPVPRPRWENPPRAPAPALTRPG